MTSCFFSRLAGTLSVLLFTSIATLHAAPVAGPGWRATETEISTLSAPGKTPSVTKQSTPIAQASPGGVSPLSLYAGPSATALTPELQALASGLDYDPTKIFNYVHNKIEFQPYYGSHKGAHVTYLDRAGDDMDQASLLIALLNQATGVTATSYVYGQYTMPDRSADGRNLGNWLGLSATALTANPNLAGNVLGNSGIPTSTGTNYGSYVTWPFVHVWVRATIGGVSYDLDPSYKQYEVFNAIDYKTASGYNRAQLITDAAGTTGADYAQNLNRTNLEGRFGAYTTALRNYLKTNVPNASIEEIIGGRRILEQPITALSQGAPPTAFAPTITTTFSSIPAQYAATLRVQVGNLDVTFNADALQGNRLSLVFASNQAQLWLGDSNAGQESGGSGTTASVTITATHPYSNVSQTLNPVTYLRSGSYDLTYSFYNNPKSSGLVDASNRRLENYLASGLTDTSRQVLTETLHLFGIKWARQVGFVNSTVGSLQTAFNSVHHVIGRTGQETGYYVDMPGVFVTMFDATGANLGTNYKAFNTAAFLSSAMEHGVLEQGGSSGAASTVKCLALANDAGQKIFKANSANYIAGSNVKSQLTNYSSYPFDAYVNGGYTVLLHQDGQITNTALAHPRWQGYGFAGIANTQIGMIIGGGYAGGFNFSTGTASGSGANTLFNTSAQYQATTPSFVPQTLSNEPVDLLTGAYTMQSADLALGEQNSPRGLNFTRYYDSSRNFQTSALGNGWRHSCEGKVALSSELDAAFGLTQPTDAVQTIIGVLAAGDFADTSYSAKELLIGSLAANWTVNRILNNTANVQLGNQRMTYVSQPADTATPNGSWNPPASSTTALTRSTGANPIFTLTPRFGGSVVFDTSNRVSQWKDVDNNTQTSTYNGTTGKLATVQDKWGRTLTFNYYSSGAGNGLLQNVTDSTGRVVSFSYTAGTYSGANLTQSTDPELFNTTLVYDSRNLLTDWKDHALQSISHNDYDALDRVYQQKSQNIASHLWQFRYSPGMTLEIDPQGGKTAHLFDSKNRNVGTIDALGNASSISYDSQNHVTETKDATGRKTTFLFDSNQNLSKSTDNNGKETNYTYDAGLHLWKVTDPTNRYVEYQYWPNHRLKYSYDAGRRLTQYFYRADGLLNSIIDPASNTTSFTAYDSFGNLTNITRADGTTTVATYNTVGDMQSYRDGNLKTSYFTQDKRRLPKTRTDARTKQTIWTYDANGYLNTTRDRNLNTTTTTFDNLGHLRTVLAPDTGVVTYGYDTRDWLTSVTDVLTHATTYEYYANGWPKKTFNALSIQMGQLDYDAAGRVAAQYAGQLPATQFHYDTAGRLDYTLDPMTRETDHGYDDAGRALSLKNRRNKTFNFGYSADGLASTFSYPSTRQSQIIDRELHGLPKTLQEPSGQQAVLTYDAMQRLKTQTDGVGAITWTYDNEGNAKDVDEVIGGVPKNLHRVYDNVNRLTSCTDSQSFTVGYSYDDEGNVASITYPGGKVVSYTYDGSNRVKTVTDWSTPTGRVTTYNYDTAGRLSSVVRPNSTRQRVVFDNADRLQNTYEEKMSGSTVVGTLWQAGYGFDNAHRLTTFTPTPLARTYAPLAVAMTYNGDNQVATVNGQSVSHDLDGNMLTAPLASTLLDALSWDARNRLLSAGGVTYTYDAENRRTTSTVGGQTTKYVWARGGGLDKLLAKINPDLSVTRYVYGTGLLYEETTSFGGVASAPIYYHFDWRGDTVALSDPSGTVTARLSYSPYGERTIESGTVTTPFCFNGQWGVMTEASGLLSMQARYYSPVLRRFLNEDPSGFAGGVNLYAFAAGDPVNLMDPFGLGPVNSVGAPGFAESLIPIWGSGRAAVNDFQNGNYGWAAVNTALAISDVFLVKSAVTAVGKLIVEGGAKLVAQEAVGIAGKEVFAGGCFAEGTIVSTPDGDRRIEDLEIGDLVWAYNFETGQAEAQPVTELFRHTTSTWIDVQFAGGSVHATPQHLFWVESLGEWVKASALLPGMAVRQSNGGTTPVLDVSARELATLANTFNLNVEADHVYFVGPDRVLVHNSCVATAENLVYRSVNEAGEVVYVGITNNLERRAGEQLAGKGIEIGAIPGLQNLARADARAVEQVLIETNGLGKTGGTLLNKINSISQNNPLYAESLKRGAQLLKQAGYAGF